ncbi:MAG: nucleotide exchange factor GrpE [Pseudomonadota bacterium]
MTDLNDPLDPEKIFETSIDESEEDAQEGATEAPDVDVDVETEVALIKDQLLRALAETENVRRRAAKDKEEAAKYSITSFARDLLTVADNLRRALENIAKDKAVESTPETKSLIEGVILTEKELLSVFQKHGIQQLSPMSEKFDHDFHQAMFEIESDEQPAGTIVQMIQSGYVLHGRLLRPALVGVAKAKTNEESEN